MVFDSFQQFLACASLSVELEMQGLPFDYIEQREFEADELVAHHTNMIIPGDPSPLTDIALHFDDHAT